MIPLDEQGPPLTEDAISSFERTLPSPLPDDYRNFLLDTNGGSLEPNWWPPEVSLADFDVDLIYSLGDVADYQSLTLTREIYQGRIPGSFLVVAGDSNGNQLCLALAEDRGSVWFFNHELETDPQDGADPDLMTRVSNSFTELLDTLEPLPGLDEMTRRGAAARAAADPAQ